MHITNTDVHVDKMRIIMISEVNVYPFSLDTQILPANVTSSQLQRALYGHHNNYYCNTTILVCVRFCIIFEGIHIKLLGLLLS